MQNTPDLGFCNHNDAAVLLCRSPPGAFDPVIPDPLLTSNPYKRQVLVTLRTSRVGKWFESKISLLIDRQRWLRGQLNVQVIGNTERLWKVLKPAVKSII